MSTATIATLALVVSLLSLVVSGHVAWRDRARVIARSMFYPESEFDNASVHVSIVNGGRRSIVIRLFGGTDKGGVTLAVHLNHEAGGLLLTEHARWDKRLSSYEDIDSMAPDDEMIEYATLWFEDTLGRRYNVRDSAANIKKLRQHLKERRQAVRA